MHFKSRRIKLIFTEPLLGTTPLNEQLFEDFVASARADEAESQAEAAGLADAVEKLSTGFHRTDGRPILYDYQVKGFFKDACSMLRRIPGTLSAEVKAYKKMIDGLIFVVPRQIPLHMPEGAEISWLQRPLRAQTRQGERMALARSEVVPAGSWVGIEVLVPPPDGRKPSDLWPLVGEWLDYGRVRGLGQWRNAGWGRFEWEEAGVPAGDQVNPERAA